MLTLPPKIFFDTQIISCAERGSIGRDVWRLVCTYLRQTCRYCISALTLGELLVGLANSDPKYFTQHQRRLQTILKPSSDVEVFDFVPYFVANALGVPLARSTNLESDFLKLICQILEAPTKEALLDGFDTSGGEFIRVNLSTLTRQIESKRLSYFHLMDRRRQARVRSIPIEVWSAEMLKLFRLDATPELLALVAIKLSAAYEFEMSINNLIQNSNFSIRKSSNQSSLFDGQQLCYLSDDQVIFVTDDADFRNSIRKSEQAKRVISFARLQQLAECGLPPS